MDLYYHNESDPDSYCCPGDNSKSPPTNPVVLYSSSSSRLSPFFPSISHTVSPLHKLSLLFYLSPATPSVTSGSFLFIICSLVYFTHQSKMVSYQSFAVCFPLVCLLRCCPDLTAVEAEKKRFSHVTLPHHLASLILPLNGIITVVHKPRLLFVALWKLAKR